MPCCRGNLTPELDQRIRDFAAAHQRSISAVVRYFIEQGLDITSEGLRHGAAKSSRSERYGFDKYLWPAGNYWPQGLEMHVYDDGRVKVGGWHTSVVVLDVSSYGTGNSNASGHVIARFEAAPDA
jgi:plasmid stability protein